MGGPRMPSDLTHLSPHIDEMRTKLAQSSEAERLLVQRLSEELKRFDQATLQGVRTMAAEHEARRAGIFDELQALAASIGTFKALPSPTERAALPVQPAAPQPSYHDQLAANLHALLTEGSGL